MKRRELKLVPLPDPEVPPRAEETDEMPAAIDAEQVDAFVATTPAGDRVLLTDRGVERPYRLMLDGMSEGAATIAPDGTILYANRRLAEMLRRPVAQVVPSSFFDVVDAQHGSMLRAIFADGAAGEWRGEVVLRASDRGEVPVHLSLTSLVLERDTVVLSALLTDLREQKRTDAVVAAGQLAQRILDQASEAIVVCDEDTRIRQVNREALRLSRGADPRGQLFAEAFDLAFLRRDASVGDLLSGRSQKLRARVGGPRGTRQLMVSASSLRGTGGHDLGAVITLTDFTDLHEATEQLERHTRQQRCTAELSHRALAGADLHELAESCRDALTTLLDDVDVRIDGRFARGDWSWSPLGELAHPGVVRRTIGTAAGVLGELHVDPGPGRTLSADDIDFVDSLASLLGLASEQHVLHDKLRHQAHHDALTGLPNRLLLEERLQAALRAAERDGTMVAILFIDLDRFKHINDTLGHHAGNTVLVQVGQRLRTCVRERDTVARLGGDEFVLVYGDLRDADGAVAIAGAVTAALAEPFDVDGRAVKVRATLGVSTFPRDGVESGTLITRSDSAMYFGKRGGRNSVQFFTETMEEVSAARLELEYDFQVALLAGALELHFQPQVCVRSGALRGLEALARWNHPTLGWIRPARFVPVAEEMGLVVDLGNWALREACRQASRWAEGRPDGPLRVSVNISPTHFARHDFFESVRAALARTGLDPALLELEVTESIMMHDIETVTRVLTDLRELGVGIALDDFGLGYSSVGYLRNLPLDRLKIDKSFVETRGVHDGSHEEQLAVLSAITTMAKALGLLVTVEGVETREQREVARSVGTDEVQGYLFGRPLSAERTLHLVRHWQGLRE